MTFYARTRRDTPIWLEAVASLEMAKARIFELAQDLPGEYIIFHAATSEIVNKIQFNQDVIRRDLEYLDGA
jgi:hypothetical protein